jgi:hypothetical protein
MAYFLPKRQGYTHYGVRSTLIAEGLPPVEIQLGMSECPHSPIQAGVVGKSGRLKSEGGFGMT